MIDLSPWGRLKTVNVKTAVKWMWVPVLVAGLYAGGSVVLRRHETKEMERQAAAKNEETTRKADRQIIDQLGGGQMKVLAFYASPAALHPGEKGLLCYGVASAKTVRIEPGVEPVNPALSKCVEIRPARDTEFKLTATDVSGHAETASVKVPVR